VQPSATLHASFPLRLSHTTTTTTIQLVQVRSTAIGAKKKYEHHPPIPRRRPFQIQQYVRGVLKEGFFFSPFNIPVFIATPTTTFAINPSNLDIWTETVRCAPQRRDIRGGLRGINPRCHVRALLPQLLPLPKRPQLSLVLILGFFF
jgi:hypothetical protein